MRDAVQPRFLLLATPRTGSTTVIRTLEQHPQIVGEREYLHAPNWRGANAVWPKLWRRWPELLIPLRAAMISRARRRPVYGLSVFPQHVRHIRRLTVRLQRAGWLILRLQRQSLFDQTLSYAVADRTKRWHRGREQVREAQLAQYNFILVVGQQEAEAGTVNVRTRDNEVQGTIPIAELLAKFQQNVDNYL